MRIAYIAHAIGGDVEKNLEASRKIVKEINLSEPETVPFAPYYADVVSMDDSIAEERQRGIKNDIAILQSGLVTELRLYGSKISCGMQAEIVLARAMGIPIIPMSEYLAREL